MTVFVIEQDLPARDVFIGLCSDAEKAVKRIESTMGCKPESIELTHTGMTIVQFKESRCRFKIFPCEVE